MAHSPARNRPRLDSAAVLRRLAHGGGEGVAANSTLPMLAGGWRSEGFGEDLEAHGPPSLRWRRGRPPAGHAPAPSARRPRWWRLAAVAVLPLISVALAAALWMKLPH